MKRNQICVDSNDIVFLAQFATAGFIPDSKTHCFRFQFVAESSGKLYTVGLSKKTGGWEINAPYHFNTFKKPKTAKEIGKMVCKLIGSKAKKARKARKAKKDTLTEEEITRLLNHLDLTEDTFLADNLDWDDETDLDEICNKLKILRAKQK